MGSLDAGPEGTGFSGQAKPDLGISLDSKSRKARIAIPDLVPKGPGEGSRAWFLVNILGYVFNVFLINLLSFHNK